MHRFLSKSLVACLCLLSGILTTHAVVVGEITTFKAKAQAANAYEWTFPGEINKNGAEVTHVFTTPGSQSVTLKVTGSDGQVNQTTKRVTVQNADRPTAIIEVVSSAQTRNGNLTLQADDTITLNPDLTGQNAEALEYFWSVNGQQIRKETITEREFNGIGSYRVNLTVFNSLQPALSHEANMQISVENSPPEVSGLSVNPDSEYKNVRVSVNANDEDGDIAQYRFEVLENNRSILSQIVTSNSTSFNLSQFPGEHDYTFRVTVTDDLGGKTSYENENILSIDSTTNNTPPEFEIILAPGNEGEIDEWFNLFADATDADGDALRYQWIFPDGQQFFSSQVRHQFKTGGEKTIVARVNDGIEFVEKEISLNIKTPENETPEVSIESIFPAQGDTRTLFRFKAQGSDADGDRLFYDWDMGDGGRAVSAQPTYRFETPGTYTVRLQVSDGSLTNIDSTTITVAAASDQPIDPINNQAPTVTIATSNENIGVNQSVRFSSQAIDPDNNALQYTWVIGDSIRYFNPQITHQFVEPGQYNVSLTVTDGDLSATDSLTMNVAAATEGSTTDATNTIPVVRILSITPQNSGDLDTVFRFYTQGQDADGDTLRYTWDMGDGNQMFIQNPAYRFTEAGTYTVEVTADDGIDSVSDQVTIQVEEPFRSAATTETVYYTQNPDGTYSPTTNTNDPNTTYYTQNPDGSYSVVRTSNDTVYYIRNTDGTYVPAGDTNDPNQEYYVQNSDGTFSPLATPLGSNNPPSISITAVAPSSSGDTHTLFRFFSQADDPEGQAVQYTWNMGDGNQMRGVNPIYRYATPGTYTVTGIVSDGFLNATSEVTVNVAEKELALNNPENNQAPIAEPENITVVESNDATVQLDANAVDADGDEILYTWILPDGTRYYTPSIDHDFGAPGEYEVLLEISDGLGVSRTTKTVVVSGEDTASNLIYDLNAPDLASIEQTQFSANSCQRFGNRIQTSSIPASINFSSALLALQLQRAALSEESAITNIDTQINFITKWQNEASAANQKIIEIQTQIPTAQRARMTDFGVLETDTLAIAHQKIWNAVKPNWDQYQAETNATTKAALKKQLATDLKARTVLYQWYDPAEHKANFSDKKQRLISQQKKWQNSLDFTTDSTKEAELTTQINANQDLLNMIEAIETQIKAQLEQELQFKVSRCLESGADPEILTLMQNLDIDSLSTERLLDLLAVIEGTTETNFFLYAKASQAYSKNALLFEWDLGDGRKVFGQNINFKYLRAGVYEVELKVSDELTSSRDRLRIRVYKNWPTEK